MISDHFIEMRSRAAPPTSYIVGISEHTQHLQYTMGKVGMRGTSWPADKCTLITVCVHPGKDDLRHEFKVRTYQRIVLFCSPFELI